MDLRKVLKFIFGIIILCAISIGVIELLPISGQLKDGIISEIMGGGILGAIVAGVFFYLGESNEFQINKKKAITAFQSNVLLDIKEVIERGPTIWNLSGANKFYFDGSMINSFFDMYSKNLGIIDDYFSYFPKDPLVNLLRDFYITTRKGYLLGERLENLFRQLVRKKHHEKGLIRANDGPMVAFIRAKMYANLPDTELLKHLEWASIPDRANEILQELKINEEITNLINEVKQIRQQAMDTIAKIENIPSES